MVKSMRGSLSALIWAVFLVGSVRVACPDGDLTGDCEVDFENVRVFGCAVAVSAGVTAIGANMLRALTECQLRRSLVFFPGTGM